MTIKTTELALQIRLLDWNRAQVTPPITPGYEYGVAAAALELMQPATRQYYYQANGCKAHSTTATDCICWHDEGTGPLFNNHMTTVQPSSWRDKPQSELAALREELAKVIEDRARFPDRPDFIGHMIGSHIGNLKAGKESSDNYARKWYDRMKVAEQRLADAERRNAELVELLNRVVQLWAAHDTKLQLADSICKLAPVIRDTIKPTESGTSE